MKRTLSVTLIILGLGIVFLSFVSVSTARWTLLPRHEPTYGPDGIPNVVIYTPPPQSSGFALGTTACGLIVAGIGLMQVKAKTRLAIWHVSFGLLTALGSAILSVAIASDPWVTGSIYSIAYLTLVMGLLIAGLGINQLLASKNQINIETTRPFSKILKIVTVLICSMMVFASLHTWITRTIENNLPRRMTGVEAFHVVSAYIPRDFLERGYFNWFHYDGSIMTLVFDIPTLITREQLGWQENPGVEIEHTGALPPGTFIELSFKINGYTGEVLSMKASDAKIPTPFPGPPMTV